MTLTVSDLENKIAMVNDDLVKLRSEPGNDRKVSMLIDYIDYLKDELKEAKIAERLNKGT
jgi:hypothetical protein